MDRHEKLKTQFSLHGWALILLSKVTTSSLVKKDKKLTEPFLVASG